MVLGSNLHCVCAVWEPTPWGKKRKPKDGSQGGAAPGPHQKQNNTHLEEHGHHLSHTCFSV